METRGPQTAAVSTTSTTIRPLAAQPSVSPRFPSSFLQGIVMSVDGELLTWGLMTGGLLTGGLL